MAAAVTALGLTPAALLSGRYGHRKATLTAAAGFAAWSRKPKTRVAEAFGALHASTLSPSGLKTWLIPDEAVAAVVAALKAMGPR